MLYFNRILVHEHTLKPVRPENSWLVQTRATRQIPKTPDSRKHKTSIFQMEVLPF